MGAGSSTRRWGYPSCDSQWRRRLCSAGALLYKPRRDRKRLASVLYAEILQNAQVILVWSHARQDRPKSVPGDFRLPAMGFEATADLLRYLPTKVMQKVLLLYGQYSAANEAVAVFGEAFEQFQAQKAAGQDTTKIRRHMDTIIDTFNTGLDRAFERSKEVLPEIMVLGGITEEIDPDQLPPDYEELARRHLSERAIRLRGFEEMDSESGDDGDSIGRRQGQ